MRMSKTIPIGKYKIFCTSCCTEAKSIVTTTGSIPRSLFNVRHKNCGVTGQMVYVYSEPADLELKWQAFSIVGIFSFITGFMLAMLIATASK